MLGPRIFWLARLDSSNGSGGGSRDGDVGGKAGGGGTVRAAVSCRYLTAVSGSSVDYKTGISVI